MSPEEVDKVWTYGSLALAATVLCFMLGGVALLTMRVFDRAAQGPMAMTVVVLLAFLTAISIAAAVVVDGSGKEFITLAAAGIGALAGAVTNIYQGGRNGTSRDDDEPDA